MRIRSAGGVLQPKKEGAEAPEGVLAPAGDGYGGRPGAADMKIREIGPRA